MGSSSSSPEQEKEFLNLLSNLSKEDFIDNAPIIEAAGKLRQLSFVSNQALQAFFLKEPSNIFSLIIRCSDILYSGERDNKTVCGALLIISRLLPIICISFKDIKDLDWLLAGEESVLEKLVVGVKAAIFAEGITTLSKDANLWTWENISKDMENARYDIISIFVFLVNYQYFFPSNPEVQKRIHEYVLFDPLHSQNWLKSILASFTYKTVEFMQNALQYLEWALIYDPAIKEAANKLKIFDQLAPVLHYPVDNFNAIVPNLVDIEPFELDIMICLTLIYLQNDGYKPEYDIKKLTEAVLRFLQKANEKKVVSFNHKLSLLVLQYISSDKDNLQKLSEKLIFALGTEVRLHSDSFSTAILEASSTCLIMPKSKELHTLCLNVMHNIATTLPATENPVNCLTNLLIYFSQTDDQNEVFASLLQSVKRFVTSENGAEKKKLLQASCKQLLEKLSGEKKSQLEEALSATQSNGDELIAVTNQEQEIKVLQRYLIQIYVLRNKASLEMLKKNVHSE